MSPSCTLRRSSHSAKFLLEKKTLQGMCLFRASVSAGREECFHYPEKETGGAGTHTGHTRDTRAHKGTRITQTNLTTFITGTRFGMKFRSSLDLEG